MAGRTSSPSGSCWRKCWWRSIHWIPSDSLVPDPPEGFSFEVKTARPTWINLTVLAHRLLRFEPAEVERLSQKVPAPLRSIVRRALQPDPAARPGAGEMRDELGAFLGGLARPFGAEEAAAEVKSVFAAAEKVKRLLANPIERTALTPEEDRDPGQ